MKKPYLKFLPWHLLVRRLCRLLLARLFREYRIALEMQALTSTPTASGKTLTKTITRRPASAAIFRLHRTALTTTTSAAVVTLQSIPISMQPPFPMTKTDTGTPQSARRTRAVMKQSLLTRRMISPTAIPAPAVTKSP